MKIREKWPSRLFDALNVAFLALITLTFILPFLYMFAVSISDYGEVTRGTIFLIPKGVHFKAYQSVLGTSDLAMAYWNSIRYMVVATLLMLLVSVVTAYPLAQSRLKYRRFFSAMFTFTMFFSGGMIPMFLTLRAYGFIDTIWAVTLPGAFSFWNIVIIRTNFQNVPTELYESAYLDGASHWRTLFQIVLPLSMPILATLALFSAVGSWNSFFGPMLYFNSTDMQPLSILLRRVLISNEQLSDPMGLMDTTALTDTLGKAEAIKYATIFVTIGPIILVYPFAQKYFVKGALVGSVKG